MNPVCPKCHQDNPARARFCGACGTGLHTAAGRYPRLPHRSGLFVLVAVIGIWLVATRPPRVLSKVASLGPRLLNRVFQQSSHRMIDLDESKSRALYNLLAPRDVHVVVGWDDGRINVRGSAEEVDTLVALAGILSRAEHTGDGFNRSWKQAYSVRDRIERTYRLHPEKSHKLSQLLGQADLTLEVSDASDGISIIASIEDHAVMDHMVKILNGERF